MSTETKGELRWVKLAEITIHPERNPRGIVTEEDVAELTANVRESGVLQPVLCAEGEDGLELVAGYRRALAAKLAKVTEIPIYIRDADSSEEDALAENLFRVDTTALSQARALRKLQERKGLSQKALMKRFGFTRSFVAERFRLLRLPESVQDAFEDGQLGLKAVPALEKIAKASEAAAARIAGIAAKDPDAERALKSSPERLSERLVRELAAERGTVKCGDGRLRPRPPAEGELVAIGLGGYHRGVDLDELAISEDRRQELARRLEAVAEDHRVRARGDELEVGFEEADVDALRALGVLLEYKGDGYHTTRYCFDSAAVLDRIELILDDAESAQAKRQEEELREAREEAGKRGEGIPEDADPAQLLAAKEKEKKAKERAKAKNAKERARIRNLGLGVALIRRRARKRSEKRRREMVRALAIAVVSAEENLAALGPRLVYEHWQEVKSKKLKNGNTSEKITYLDPREASKRLREDIEAQKTLDDILDVIGDALVAATYASEEELPVSRRVAGFYRRLRHCDSGPVRRAIDEEAAGVLPPELQGELARSAKGGYEVRERVGIG
jgi:ParB family chromosome partitioning protein